MRRDPQRGANPYQKMSFPRIGTNRKQQEEKVIRGAPLTGAGFKLIKGPKMVQAAVMQISDKLTNKATYHLIEMLKERIQGRGGALDSQSNINFCSKWDNAFAGRAEPSVLVGPVVGKVTYDQAVILLEVDEDCELECIAIPKRGSPVRARTKFPGREARCFVFQGLTPNTVYRYQIKGINAAQEAENESKTFRFKTFPTPGNIKRLKVVAFSCDRPRRLFSNQQNPWETLSADAKDINLMLHLGDQVYTKMDGFLERAIMESNLYKMPGASIKVKKKALLLAEEQLRGAYRYNWNMPATASALSQSSHLMLWSDNDVANDFTEKFDKKGRQMYSEELLSAGLEVYTEYQRQLWDPACKGKINQGAPHMNEYAFHNYGPLGVFMVDMRGSHISPAGQVHKEPAVISDEQKAAIEDAFQTPGLQCMLICSEIPFASDTAANLQERVKQVFFLSSHWGFDEKLSNWLFNLCFSWKAAQPGREVALLGGDIHTGLIHTIKDQKTGLTMQSITASPISNHVSKYWSPLEVKYNDRFSWTAQHFAHMRNYAELNMSFGPNGCKLRVEMKLFDTPDPPEEH